MEVFNIKYKIHAPECTKTRHFYFKNSKIFWGGDTAPPPASTPSAPVIPRSLRLRRSLTHTPLGSLATGQW